MGNEDRDVIHNTTLRVIGAAALLAAAGLVGFIGYQVYENSDAVGWLLGAAAESRLEENSPRFIMEIILAILAAPTVYRLVRGAAKRIIPD